MLQHYCPFEVANVCRKKMRRHPERRDALMIAFEMLDRMEIGVLEVDQGEALVLAERAGLTPTTRAIYGSHAKWASSW